MSARAPGESAQRKSAPMARAEHARAEPARAQTGPWLFTARVDLAVFLGSAVLSLALLGVGAQLGILHDDTPEWAWVPAVLLIDVAHVWSTIFRVYLDRGERRRRPWLYLLTPLFVWILGMALYSEGAHVFWRVLAYVAVFHFVRQQYGWVALYRARAREPHEGLGRWLDTAAIYAATVYPLLHWHAHLPRAFAWFLPGDFAAGPPFLATLATAAAPVYWAIMAAYALRAAHGWLFRGQGNPGKDIVVATTAVCWYVGIVAFDSDYAFTVTNVIIHGVPYFALIYWYGRRRRQADPGDPGLAVFRHGPWLFLAVLWLLAYAEELLWHRLVWLDRAWLFGAGWDLAWLHVVLVPLLAMPQATHYVLDGFIWRRRGNPGLRPA